jgi:hypothetical protein
MNKSLEKKINHTQHKLSIKTKFKKIKLNYSEKTKKLLSNILIVNETDQLQLYGLNSINKKIYEYLANVLNNDSKTVQQLTNLIEDIINDVINGFNEESALIYLRVTLPSDNHEIPRWHIDGPYFPSTKTGPYAKFATTLIGPGTLLYEDTDKSREKYINLTKDISLTKIDKRLKIAKIFNDKQKIIQTKNNEGVLFLVSDPERISSAFHSEPHMTESRIFLGITPGSNNDLNERKKTLEKLGR